jgi:hypothetical protein
MGKKTLLNQIQRLLDRDAKPKQRQRQTTRDEHYDKLAIKFAEEHSMGVMTPAPMGE